MAGRRGGLGGLHLRLARLTALAAFSDDIIDPSRTHRHTHCIDKFRIGANWGHASGGASKFVMLFGINLRHLFVPTRHTFRVALSAFS